MGKDKHTHKERNHIPSHCGSCSEENEAGLCEQLGAKREELALRSCGHGDAG